MTRALRWGLLGTAKINGGIIPAIRASKRGELVAVASREAGRAEGYAREWNIPRWHGSYENLLADPDIDVIYNSLPNSLHAPWTIRSLTAGKHVLCEKPFALTTDEVDAMFAAAHAAGRVVADGFMYRHHPRIKKLHELSRGGAIGEVRLIRACFSFMFDRPDNPRWDPRMGGGALWDVGCYPVSLSRYLFGEPPDRVWGSLSRSAGGVDESFLATLLFPGGRVAQFDCSFVSAYRTHAEVVGTTGVLSLDLPFRPDDSGSRLTLRTEILSETIQIPENPGRYAAEVEEIHGRILDGRPPEISPAETRDNIETIVRLYESAVPI